jgi:hypothetical protein
MLRHYVFLKFREATPEAHVVEFCARMQALRDRIDTIQLLEIGRDELHDARSWDLVLIMEFASLEALRLYQRHPAHVAVMTFNQPFVDSVASIDFTDAAPATEPCDV